MTDKQTKKGVVNLNTITSYGLTLKYTGYTGGELSREKRFATYDEAVSEAERVQNKVMKEGGMSVRYDTGPTRYIFYFASQLKNLSISEIEANEKTTDISAILGIS